MIQNHSNDRSSSRLPSPAVALAVAALLIPNIAWGFVEISRGELLFQANARVTSDSNIYGNDTEVDDVIWSVEPSLVYTRRAGRLNVDGRVGVSINRFDDTKTEDSDDKFARLEVTVPTATVSPLQGSFYLDYFQGRRVDLYLSDRIAVDAFSTGFQGSYKFDPKIDLRFATDYLANYPDQRSNSSSRSFTLGGGYRIRPKVSAFADYRFRRSKSEYDRVTGLGIGTKDQAVFLGLTGDLSAVMTGTISAGTQSTRADANDSGGNASQFVAQVSLEWTPRQRTSVFINASSDSSVTNAERTVEKVGFNVGVKEKIARAFSAEGRIGWDDYRYRTTPKHSEDMWSMAGIFGYEPNSTFSLAFEVNYFSRDPGISPNFNRTTYGLSGTFKY